MNQTKKYIAEAFDKDGQRILGSDGSSTARLKTDKGALKRFKCQQWNQRVRNVMIYKVIGEPSYMDCNRVYIGCFEPVTQPATAPTLLESLRTITAYLQEAHQDEIDNNHNGDSKYGCTYCQAIHDADRAIAKAEGRE
jgi:hypothetical protein